MNTFSNTAFYLILGGLIFFLLMELLKVINRKLRYVCRFKIDEVETWELDTIKDADTILRLTLFRIHHPILSYVTLYILVGVI